MSKWTLKTDVNTWTCETQARWRKSTYTGAGHVVQYEVQELDGRYYWSANIMIRNRPDLSRFAYGTFAITPQSLTVAKCRASRVGRDALRAAASPLSLS